MEFAIDGGVPDISKYVTRVVEMHGNHENRTIYTPEPPAPPIIVKERGMTNL